MSCLYLLLLGFLLVVQNNATPAVTCGKGYGVLQGKCADENECDGENPICGENAVCYNTNGSYYCQCVTGYQTNSKTVNFTLDESGECEDINECLENICGPNANCKNTPGSYDCTCNLGFVASNREKKFNASQKVTCNDVNECLESENICGPNAECRNTDVSYYCMCHSGFVVNGQERFNSSQSVTCNNQDECVSTPKICGNHSVCHNTFGSYYCTCVSGYTLRSGRTNFTMNDDRNNTCIVTRKSSEDKTRCAPDAEGHKTSCTDAESSARQQQFNPAVSTFLPVILWMFMLYQ